MKLAVLGGAGKMGSGVVRDLVSKESRDVEKVIVVDTTLRKMEMLVEELRDKRLEVARLDVTVKESILDLLKEVDVCVNTVPTFAGHQMDLFHCCLETRCPYLDLGGMAIYTEKQKAEHEEWVKEGVPAILGLGADPGMSNIIVKAVADKLNKIDKISLYWGAKVIGPESPVFVPPYNILTLLGEYAHTSKQFMDGKLVELPPQSGKQPLDLGKPFDKMWFIHTQHSEPITVPFSRGIKDKGIKEFTWRLCLPHEEDEVLRSLVKIGFGDFNEPLKVKGGEILPGEFLEALIENNIAKNRDKIPEKTNYEIHLAIGEGKIDDTKARVTCSVNLFPDPFFSNYNDPATSMCSSIGSQILGRGNIPPGVWGPEECVDVKEFFRELRKRHFKIAMKIEMEEEL